MRLSPARTSRKYFLTIVAVMIGASSYGWSEALSSPDAAVSLSKGAAAGAAIEIIPHAGAQDSCSLNGLDASPSRPTWTGGASTSECGQLQSDFGFLLQPMDDSVAQRLLPASIRYGLTPRVELRWGLPTHIEQSGGPSNHLTGISDQVLSVLYRFHDQGQRSPAMALSYGAKIPSANPHKGLGTGYTDHQAVFVVSRDVRRVHFDFNFVGSLAGCPDRYDRAIQFGLLLSAPVSKRLTWELDNYGGSQPGTSDRYGAELMGATLMLRPWLVLDAAYTRAYTAGSPRQQITMGFTHSTRLGALPFSTGSRLGRMLRH